MKNSLRFTLEILVLTCMISFGALTMEACADVNPSLNAALVGGTR